MVGKISKRKLTEEEIGTLVEEIKSFPDLILIPPKRWRSFKEIYVALENNQLAGVFVVIHLKYWIKLGPGVVLKNHQSKGYGKLLFSRVLKDHPKENIFLASSNPKVWRMSEEFGFRERKGFFSLPAEIKLYLIKQAFEGLSLEYLIDVIRKNWPPGKRKMRYFLKICHGNI